MSVLINNPYAKKKVSVDSLIENEKLSLRAKGLWFYFYFQPNGWNFSIEDIAKYSKEGVSTIKNTIKELEAHGFLERARQRSEDGRWLDSTYILYESPELPIGGER